MTKATYCSKSWTDINIDFENRLVRHCCKSTPYDFPEQLTEQFISSSPNIQDRRQQTLNGVAHSDCASCWNDYDKGNSAYRDWANKWDNAFVEVHKNNLNTDKHIHYIEIKTDNTCDMACLYCSSYSSSKIAQEEGQPVINKTNENDYTVFKQWMKQHVSSTITDSEIIFIFLGGEPTASERFYELADYIETLTDLTDKKIRLEICTNANSKRFLMDKMIDRLDRSKLTWGIGISNESFGEDSELIRHGLSWTRFQDNFKRYITHPKTELIVLSPTINIFNLKSFPRYVSWVHEQFRNHAPHKQFTWFGNYISWPDPMDIAHLPRSYTKYVDLLEQTLVDNSSDCNYMYQENFFNYIKQMRSRIGTTYNSEYKAEARKFLEQKQSVKKTDRLIKLMNNLDL